MNADRLLALYEKVAEAPDAGNRLRRFVLDLAVRGKLVAQDPGDEPASELLKRIATEKARLEEAGRARRSKDVEPQSTDTPFALPENWAWTNLQKLARARMGKTILSKELTDSGLPVFSAGMENRPWGYIEASEVVFSRGTIVISARGGIGYPKLPDFDQFVSTQTTIACECFDSMVAPYLCLVLEVLPDWPGMKSQTAIPMITVKQVHGIPIPLPPLAEQRRIVAKVEELMALLDRLEAARGAAQATRDRLTAASLARLTAPDADDADLPANVRFALATLPALTTRPDQIKPLRQTILNLAVRGKLVEQDPTDKPASELLKQIGEAKGAAKGRKGARAKGVPAATESTDTEVPLGWEPVRLEDVAVSMRYGTSIKCDYDEKHAPVLRIPNVSSGQITLDDMKYGPLSEADREALSLEADDLLMIRSNGSLEIVGRPAVVPPEAAGMAFAGYLVRLQTLKEAINSRYVWLALNSSAVRDQIERPIRSAVGLKNVNLTEFGNLSFWLPPIAEQHRIVAKVDALMALCDRLEAALATADSTRARLLEALIADALNPASMQEMEAAE